MFGACMDEKMASRLAKEVVGRSGSNPSRQEEQEEKIFQNTWSKCILLPLLTLQPSSATDRAKYTEKPVAAIAAEERANQRPQKGSVAQNQQFSFDDGFPPLDGDDGFPPISGPSDPAPELPSPIEMSVVPADDDKSNDKISGNKRRSSFGRQKKDKEKSDKISANPKRRSRPM